MKTKEKTSRGGRPARAVVDPESAGAMLGAEIKRRREQMKLSGGDLAKLATVGQTTLYDTEAGVNTPTIAVLVRLDRALNAGGRLVGFAYRLDWPT